MRLMIVSIIVSTAILSGAVCPALAAKKGGGELFEEKCGACHSLERPKSKIKTEESWRKTVLRMKNINGCPLTDAEAEQIIEFLAKEYGPIKSHLELPDDYRTWTAVAPSHRLDKGHIRMILSNDVMTQAYREKSLPFPDGSTIVKLVYEAVKSPEWEEAVVPGNPLSIEIWTKDSKKYPETVGWQFARFKPNGEYVDDEALYKTCFPCHEENVSGHDYIFTRWAP